MKIKIRFVCQDLSKNIFYLYHNIDDFYNGLNLAKNGRIEKIISTDLFTGLRASDIKEIYEGDRINAIYCVKLSKYGLKDDINNKRWYSGIVKFIDGAFCLYIDAVPIVNKITNDYGVGQTPELNNFSWIEIVGNIYEGCAEPPQPGVSCSPKSKTPG